MENMGQFKRYVSWMQETNRENGGNEIKGIMGKECSEPKGNIFQKQKAECWPRWTNVFSILMIVQVSNNKDKPKKLPKIQKREQDINKNDLERHQT